MKKMKKRRELDALVNGKLGRRKKGQHELLRNETDSSEVEEFSIPEKTVMRKGSSCRFCTTCVTVCGFFMLVTCVAAIAGLVWVHIELKKEVDVLRSQLGQVQINAPQNLQQIAQKQLQLEKTVRNLNEASLGNIQLNISKLFTQISLLNSSVSSLSKQLSAENSPQLENKELMQNIATLGSTVQSLQTEVSHLTPLQDLMSSQKEKLQMIDVLVNEIDSLNQTFIEHYHDSMVSLQYVMNKTESLELRFNLIEAKPNLSASLNTRAMMGNAIQESLRDALKNVTLPATNLDMTALKQLEELVHTVQDQVVVVNVTLTEKIQETSKNLEQTNDRVTLISRNLEAFQNLTDAELKQVKADFSEFITQIEGETSTATDTKLADTPLAENTKTTETPSSSSSEVAP